MARKFELKDKVWWKTTAPKWSVVAAILITAIVAVVFLFGCSAQSRRMDALETRIAELERSAEPQLVEAAVTQDDLEDYVRQEDLGDYVTQDDLGSYVVEADLDGYLTKEDVASFVTEEQISELFDEDGQLNVVTREEFNDFRGDVDSAQELAEKVDAVERFANRISESVNALIERVLILFVGEGDLGDLQDLQIEEGEDLVTPEPSNEDEEDGSSSEDDGRSGTDDLVIVVSDGSEGNRQAIIGRFVSAYGTEGLRLVPYNSLQAFLASQDPCDLAILDNVDDGALRGSEYADKVGCPVIGNDQSVNLNRDDWNDNNNVVAVCSKNDWACIQSATESALPRLKELRQNQ